MRRSVLGGLVLCLTLTAAGCGGDDGTDPEAGASSSAAPSEAATSATTEPTETTGSAQPEESTGASSDTYASFEPAAGQQLNSGTAVLSAPADWPQNPLDDTTSSLIGPSPDYAAQLSELTAADPAASTDDLVVLAKEFGSYTDAVQRLDDVTIAGTPAYHLAGPDSIFTGSIVDEFGLTAGGRDYTIRVSTPKDLAQADRDALVGTVLASFQLTGA